MTDSYTNFLYNSSNSLKQHVKRQEKIIINEQPYQQQQASKVVCVICSYKSKQINLILNSILVLIRKIEYPTPTVTAFKDRSYSNSFAKMINCIFKGLRQIKVETISCPHNRLKKHFLQELEDNFPQIKMNEDVLQQFSQMILMNRIKRLYQMQTVVNQLKATQHIIPDIINLDKRIMFRQAKRQSSHYGIDHTIYQQRNQVKLQEDDIIQRNCINPQIQKESAQKQSYNSSFSNEQVQQQEEQEEQASQSEFSSSNKKSQHKKKIIARNYHSFKIKRNTKRKNSGSEYSF